MIRGVKFTSIPYRIRIGRWPFTRRARFSGWLRISHSTSTTVIELAFRARIRGSYCSVSATGAAGRADVHDVLER